ncbi:Transforming growth factor-beta, C-terminal domain-containing protein [Strongyloides ratti]|uniref:Transforming growth factor-beta, C-terminal domain-containing protein n=1 Tax=Strongyloides ratti TaxID=34506 RepID=A0A090LNT6_STRRB|nr:Transforming growth factor-beta, C-terminal domain-containing protein [Strongyloides ratti]CEF71431.1 Transforming growth factor-beta, C-terminal domain-containing protein [Strongyloides ratti]
MLSSTLCNIILLCILINLIFDNGTIINDDSFNNKKNDSEIIIIINHLKRKLGIQKNDSVIDTKHFYNTIINGKHFGESYHKSEKIKKYFEKTGILLHEDSFMIDKSKDNKQIVLIGKRSPYEKDNDILTHFEFNKNIFKNIFIDGFFILNLKNVKINKNTSQKSYLQIYRKYYDEDNEDEIILNYNLDNFNSEINKNHKIYIQKDILKKLINEKLSDFTVYSKIVSQNDGNISILDIKLPFTIVTLHLIIDQSNERKRRSQSEECNSQENVKSCCIIDKYINLHSFGQLKNIAFPAVINVKQCKGNCILNDYQSKNSYFMDNFFNKTFERTKCCRPTKFETINFVLKKDNLTALELSVDDLIVKECECY